MQADRSVQDAENNASCGGLIRDANGRFTAGILLTRLVELPH